MKKKITMMTMSIALCLVAVMILAACGGGGGAGNIAVISRDAVSGSRQSFDYSVRIGAQMNLTKWQQTMGNRIPGDMYNSQAGVINAVERNTNAIGYASLSAIDKPENAPNVKMLNINTSAPNFGGNGSAPGAAGYPDTFIRDFVIMVPTGVTLMNRTQVFYDFLQSTLAAEVISDFGLDVGDTLTGTFDAAAQGSVAPAQTYPIQIRGSTTVTPVMEKLVQKFVADVPWATQAMFDLDAGGSGQGRNVGRNLPISGAQSYTSGAAIGMSSAGADNTSDNGITFRLAYDTTVVIVHPQNPLVLAAAAATAAAREVNPGAAEIVASITIAELFAIYTGAVRNWNMLIAATA